MAEQVTLVTGFPSNELATRVVTRLLTQNRSTHLLCLVPARFHDRARAFLRERPRSEAERVELVEGDVTAMDLGLSGPEFRDAVRRVRVIHHLAAVTYTGAERALAERVNVTGTAEIIEFASHARQLERLVHWSSTLATSTRHGHVLEDDLLQPRSGSIARTRFRAECIIRANQERIPSTVLRPAMLAGDSKTGAMNRLEGAFLLITGLLGAPRDVPVPFPARPDAFLNLVPIDFAVEAGLALARSNETVSRTLHIVDPAPPTLEEALGLFASLLGRPTPQRSLPGPLARALLTLPILDRLTHAHSALVEELGRSARYDDRYARPVLEKAGLSCPTFPSYAPKMAAFVQRQREGGSSNKTPPPPVRLEPLHATK